MMEKVGLNPGQRTPGRKVVGHIGRSLLKAMQMAKATGEKKSAELVAAECVVLVETKDHMNWELIGEMAKPPPEEEKKVKTAIGAARAKQARRQMQPRA